MIVEKPHGVVGSKADVPCGFVELFECPIEGRAHAVCRVASALRKANTWFVLCTVVPSLLLFILCWCHCL